MRAVARFGEEIIGACLKALFDRDLGPDSLDGFALVRLLRERGLRSDVCVHSNQTGLENYRRALEEGADVFLPKPMSRLHFLKLLQETSRKRMGSDARGSVRRSVRRDVRQGNSVESAGERAESGRSVAVVDDNFIVLHAWKKHLPPGRVRVFSSPREFWSAVGDGRLLPDELLCVVTDQTFGDAAEEDGLSFLGMLEERYGMPVFLQTHQEFDEPTRARLGARLLAKRPHSLDELEALASAWHK